MVDCLVGKAVAALEQTGLRVLCVGGGVAANARLRERLNEEAGRRQIELHVAPMRLCTDNAVMGAIAVERWKAGLVENLDLDAFPGVVRTKDRGRGLGSDARSQGRDQGSEIDERKCSNDHFSPCLNVLYPRLTGFPSGLKISAAFR